MALSEREFTFGDKEFTTITRLVREHSGIVLASHKRDMVYSRLARRLRELQYRDFKDYCEYVQSPQGEGEMLHLINAITTNLTSFFREKHHFDFLVEQLKTNKELFASRRLRIWSAGCSAGMEVYSAAISICDALPNTAGWDIKLLATDIDTNMLDRSAKAIYRAEHVKDMSKAHINKYFNKLSDDSYQVSQSLRDMVSFKKLNLMDERWPMKGPFQMIFCRNVMIYFDKPTQKTLVDKFVRLLPEGSFLLVGHSENLFNMSSNIRLRGRTIYERI